MYHIKKLSLIVVCTLLISSAVLIATPKAFGHLVTPVPSVCPPFASPGVSTEHSMSVLTSTSSATATALFSVPGFTLPPGTIAVIFVLDGVASSPVTGTSPFTLAFTSLSPGPHTVVACYVATGTATIDTDIATFTIVGPSGQATGQVNILLPTCGIALVGGSLIDYGDLLPGDTSDEKTLTLDNTGNTNANVDVRGSNWLDGSGVNQMNVDNTRFSTTSGTYPSKTPLTLVDQPINALDPVLTPATNRDVFFQLQVNLIDPSFSGALEQTVDFTGVC